LKSELENVCKVVASGVGVGVGMGLSDDPGKRTNLVRNIPTKRQVKFERIRISQGNDGFVVCSTKQLYAFGLGTGV
jgi:hypothetical protein